MHTEAAASSLSDTLHVWHTKNPLTPSWEERLTHSFRVLTLDTSYDEDKAAHAYLTGVKQRDLPEEIVDILKSMSLASTIFNFGRASPLTCLTRFR